MIPEQVTVSIKGMIAVGAVVVSLAGHAAAAEYRLSEAEAKLGMFNKWVREERESTRRMQLVLCRMCTHLLPENKCKVCEE